MPEGWPRVRRTGGPPSAADAEEKCRDTEKVEHGGDATITLYLPDAQAASNDVKKTSSSTSWDAPPPLDASESMQSA
eukprot:67783-Pleurochrysis_carterae.AAC.1